MVIPVYESGSRFRHDSEDLFEVVVSLYFLFLILLKFRFFKWPEDTFA